MKVISPFGPKIAKLKFSSKELAINYAKKRKLIMKLFSQKKEKP